MAPKVSNHALHARPALHLHAPLGLSAHCSRMPVQDTTGASSVRVADHSLAIVRLSPAKPRTASKDDRLSCRLQGTTTLIDYIVRESNLLLPMEASIEPYS